MDFSCADLRLGTGTRTHLIIGEVLEAFSDEIFSQVQRKERNTDDCQTGTIAPGIHGVILLRDLALNITENIDIQLKSELGANSFQVTDLHLVLLLLIKMMMMMMICF